MPFFIIFYEKGLDFEGNVGSLQKLEMLGHGTHGGPPYVCALHQKHVIANVPATDSKLRQ